MGKTFKIGEYEFIVLEQSGDTTAVILKDLLHKEKEFGSTNNYDGSNADNLCNAFGDKIAGIIGLDNLVEFTVDLIADDGLKCYGTIKRRMALLTANQYRKYVYTLDEHKINAWWWLATAFSTPKHNYSSTVKCVSPCGNINNNYNNNNGVRPYWWIAGQSRLYTEIRAPPIKRTYSLSVRINKKEGVLYDRI